MTRIPARKCSQDVVGVFCVVPGTAPCACSAGTGFVCGGQLRPLCRRVRPKAPAGSVRTGSLRSLQCLACLAVNPRQGCKSEWFDSEGNSTNLYFPRALRMVRRSQRLTYGRDTALVLRGGARRAREWGRQGVLVGWYRFVSLALAACHPRNGSVPLENILNREGWKNNLKTSVKKKRSATAIETCQHLY